MKKQTSEQKILNALKETSPVTQAELARITKVKGVYQLVAKLVKEGKVLKNGKQVVLVAVDESTKIDGKKVSEAIYKPTKMKNISEHFQDERDRLVKEIEIRLNEYAYVMNQLMKLDDEA